MTAVLMPSKPPGQANITELGPAAVSRNEDSMRSTPDELGYAARQTAP